MSAGPLAPDPWERGFDAGWLAAVDGRRRRRLRSRFRLSGPDGYWSGWWEGYRIASLSDPRDPRP